MTARGHVICHRDERTMDNLMRGAEVTVTADPGAGWRRVEFRSNTAGYHDYAQLFDAHGGTALDVRSEDMAENKYHEHFDIDLSRISAGRVESFRLGGTSRFAEGFDFDPLADMTNLQELMTEWLTYPRPLPEIFPALQAFRCYHWKSNRFTSLGKAWADLKYLELHGFSDDLRLFAGRDLRRIALGA